MILSCRAEGPAGAPEHERPHVAHETPCPCEVGALEPCRRSVRGPLRASLASKTSPQVRGPSKVNATRKGSYRRELGFPDRHRHAASPRSLSLQDRRCGRATVTPMLGRGVLLQSPFCITQRCQAVAVRASYIHEQSIGLAAVLPAALSHRNRAHAYTKSRAGKETGAARGINVRRRRLIQRRESPKENLCALFNNECVRDGTRRTAETDGIH